MGKNGRHGGLAASAIADGKAAFVFFAVRTFERGGDLRKIFKR
jgi:hypothetical protein